MPRLAGRRWKVPKESPPGPVPDLRDLDAIARAEGRKHPDLAPNGGRWWTKEDTAFAVAILDEEMRSRALRRAWANGMTWGAARSWLSKALHHRLLDHAECARRVKLLDTLALQDLPCARDSRTQLDRQDRDLLEGRVLAGLSATGRTVAAEYFRGDGTGAGLQDGAWLCLIADRTREREMARLRAVLRRVVTKAGLTRDESLDLLFALSAKLTGGGRSVGGIRESVAGLGTVGR